MTMTFEILNNIYVQNVFGNLGLLVLNICKIVGFVIATWLLNKKRTSEKCYTFSRKRKIVWNGLNINLSKTLLDSEIRAKLTELGFLGGSKPSSITTTSKITKKVR